ncbi:hypothetical protein HX071_15345 [Myroides marinus]|uniref:hypothetical protein n=1 Tax=Myroides marinus TaxID=703342 RepID=UPI002576DA28|nr:hypothetical protein [Myroides marinus]MDM1503563.1 hypothetical protein [Myroides marinus]
MMKNKILFTIVIGVAVIAIFFMRKPTNNTDFIPVNDQGEQYFEEPDFQNMKVILIETDSVRVFIDFEKYQINEGSFVNKISYFNQQNIKAIRKDYLHPNGVTKYYMDLLISNTKEEDLKNVSLDISSSQYLDKVIDSLRLGMITIDPKEGSPGKYYFTYWYVIKGVEDTDIHLTVTTDTDGSNINVGWET